MLGFKERKESSDVKFIDLCHWETYGVVSRNACLSLKNWFIYKDVEFSLDMLSLRCQQDSLMGRYLVGSWKYRS